ncbi:MAG: tripartite tricarboxylate transporter substrate binding protein, partial [Variovorax paradoxus]|nr:tripartite tricarboxylate transporter substrate binding protein [Variovorax paradoxus]
LNRVINTVVKETEIRDKLLAQGSEGVCDTPEQLGKVVTTELVRWQKLAKEASIKVD